MPRLSKIGAAALAAFGWTGLASVSASYLVVAGGGGGGGATSGASNGGSGGGAGGYRTGTTSLNPALSYSVTVGAGGTAGTSSGGAAGKGNDSTFSTITSTGGGYGIQSGGAANGGSGGSGGGAAGGGTVGSGNTPSTSPSQGNNGGSGAGNATGGGGGAGAVGGNASGAGQDIGGNGGAGSASSISGSSVTYAGGGGGGGYTSAGTGGSGGGGAGGNTGVSGTANLGGGGGGANGNIGASTGGAGGSGVVIISYPAPQQFGGGIVTTSGSNVIHTFNTSGTLSPLSSLTASYLIVAGGAGGAYARGGGGGAGGLLSGSNLTIDTNSNYLVTVGAGGAGGTSGTPTGTNGTNSAFTMVTTTAIGGGGGGTPSATGVGVAGGSGGGGGSDATAGYAGGAGTSGQGYAGGQGNPLQTVLYGAGGGGGAGAVGSAGTSLVGGNGGVGVASSISGTSTYYAGGGGGGIQNTGTAGSGGTGGGGAGGAGSTAGTSGTANLGAGGGGGGGTSANGGSGGSGVVIISYPGSTQQMAGGTVTISGGNVIHTFTSSGYLTPIKYVNNSLRFRSSASAYLSRTFGTPTNNKKWTISGWLKRGVLSANETIFSANSSQSNYFDCRFNTSDQIYIQNRVGASNLLVANTTAVYRDPAAWYHIVFAFDSANATAANRNLLYVNGVNVSLSANSALNDASSFNASGYEHDLGGSQTLPGLWALFDGYMAEVNFIDGQALTPNSFGTFNSYGVWQPITYGGSYGTNGFYLPFTNTTSTTTLGYDFSPNGNNWTPNNIASTTSATTVRVFNSSSTWTAPAGVSSVNYLVIAGGGSGAGIAGAGGGGGAGGYLTGTLSVTSGSTYTVTVGAGGVDTAVGNAGKGNNSVFSSITATGGGQGGEGGVAGYAGGSGGGGSYHSPTGYAGGAASPSGQGNAGGQGYNGNAPYGCGGGGGAGAVGGNAGGGASGNLAGDGGAGLASSITGASVTRAGGGGGSRSSAGGFSAGAGGAGGGGAGSTDTGAPTAGTANTGGGGGGDGRGIQGANGGSGVVIISYTVDSMTDVPTLTSATAANYCVINPLDKGTGLNLTNGNLQHTADSSGNWYQARCTFAFPTTGKFYWELTFNAGTNSWCSCSIAPSTTALTMGWGPSTYANVYGMTLDGTLYTNNTSTSSYGSSFASGDIFMVAFDRDNSKIYFGKNGTWFNSSNPATQTNPAATGITTSVNLFPLVGGVNSSGGASNFGQQPWIYTPPTGYVALNTYNL